MKTSLSVDELAEYTSSQLNHLFPDPHRVLPIHLRSSINNALERVEYCFNEVSHPKYFFDGQVVFNHLHTDHYLVYLWFLSNSIWKSTSNDLLAAKVYALNKSLHGFDCMYDTGLPDIFLIFHGVGTMLGKATYSNFFVALQGVTVGSQKGAYPVIGKGVSLTAHSAIIGDCQIGDFVSVSFNTTIFDQSVSSRSVVFPDGKGGIGIKLSKTPYAQQFFSRSFEEVTI